MSSLLTLLLALATAGFFPSFSSGSKLAAESESSTVFETLGTGKKMPLGIIPLMDKVEIEEADFYQGAQVEMA